MRSPINLGALIASTATIIYLAYMMANASQYVESEFALVVFIGSMSLAFLFGSTYEFSPEKEEKCQPVPPPNPWEMQRILMRASNQPLPQHPVLDKGGVLYALLVMEEVGETFSAIASILERSKTNRSLPDMASDLSFYAKQLQTTSARLRTNLVYVDINIPLTEQEAVELLDGTTDIAVVNCGLALACGLPGAAAYDEVAGSNLSKINPTTGVIDKQPDGKWIKGIRYFKPDLRQVMIMSGSSFILPAGNDKREPG